MKLVPNPMSSCARAWLVLPSVALLMAGCASNVVILSTATRTGVEINATEAAQQGAHVGIERFEGVIMPIVASDNTGQYAHLKEAYPIYSWYYFHSGSLAEKLASKDTRGLILKQSFATGQAATTEAVRNKINDDRRKMLPHVTDPEAFHGGTKLIKLINRIAGQNPTLESQVISSVQSALKPQATVRNLTDAQNAIRSASLGGNKDGINQILKELDLYP